MPPERHPSRRQLLPLLPLWLAAATGAARAQTTAASGPVVLTLSGSVTLTNRANAAEFDMAAIERLPQHRIVTSTPWYTGEVEFAGPLLADILAAAGARGEKLRLTALNDYQVEIPFDDVRRYEIVVARLLNGKPMSVREKGPLFVIYPFARYPELRTSVYFSRCIWQLRRIDVA
jgi:hypothetical protein